MNDNYERISKLFEKKVEDSDIFSIDVLVEVQTEGRVPILDYEISHHFPYPGEPNGKIFLRSFDSGSAQFDDEWFPFYEKLTKFVAEVTNGEIKARDHERNFSVTPHSEVTKSSVSKWIEEYHKNGDITYNVLGRIRIKQ